MPSTFRPLKRRKVTILPPEPAYKARLAEYNALSTNDFYSLFLANDNILSYKSKDNALGNQLAEPRIEIDFYNVKDLSKENFEKCFALLRATSREHYAKSERGWDEEFKRDEMSESEMRFIIITTTMELSKQSLGVDNGTALTSKMSSDGTVEIAKDLEGASADDPALQNFGFLSFKLDDDETSNPRVRVPVLYVYEIHLGANLRSLGLGKHLMSTVEHIARQAEMDKVILSVFTVNTPAEQFYRRLGYGTDETSPQPRKTRKKVIPPEWVYLSLSTKQKRLDHEYRDDKS
jgi:N-alpha-acetyltransferase 40